MTEIETYRVQDKENVTLRGQGRSTGFKLFRRDGKCHVYAGNYYAPGWHQSDEKCISYALSQADDIEMLDE